jgi:DNA-binding CsgD family transcriptional regulator
MHDDSDSASVKNTAPTKRGSPMRSDHPRVLRMLCCGVRNYSALRMFKVALATVYGGVDFVSLHTTDPEIVEDYRKRFSPDFVVLANDNLPDMIAGARRLTTVARHTSTQPAPSGLKVDHFVPERPLTEKQVVLLQYLRNGWTNKRIAEYMGVHPRTVKEWLKHLYLFFGVSNRTELVATVTDFGESSDSGFKAKSS